MKFYITSLASLRVEIVNDKSTEHVHHAAWACLAADLAEAKLKAAERMEELWPLNSGWLAHSAFPEEVPGEMLAEASAAVDAWAFRSNSDNDTTERVM